MRPATAGCNIEHAWPACITILLRLLLTVYMPGLSVNRPSSVRLCCIRDSLRNHYQSVRPGFWLIKLACMFAATVWLLPLYLAVLPWFVCLVRLFAVSLAPEASQKCPEPLENAYKAFSEAAGDRCKLRGPNRYFLTPRSIVFTTPKARQTTRRGDYTSKIMSVQFPSELQPPTV